MYPRVISYMMAGGRVSWDDLDNQYGSPTLQLRPLAALEKPLALAHGDASLRWRRHGGAQCVKVAAKHSAALDCGARGGVISKIRFASFGDDCRCPRPRLL